MWKYEKFTLIEKIFREINSMVKTLLSRNFCSKMRESKFSEISTLCKIGLVQQVLDNWVKILQKERDKRKGEKKMKICLSLFIV